MGSDIIHFLRSKVTATVVESVERSDAEVAQLVEHLLGKEEVVGSIPILGSRFPVLYPLI